MRPLILFAGLIAFAVVSSTASAEPLRVYGPGGPYPAMKEAAAVFGREHQIDVQVTAGPTPQWLDHAKADADLIFSGDEAMMSDFTAALPDIDPASIQALYLRPAAILVRPGNPKHIGGIKDLFAPGHRILVVNGAGQRGLWEDVAGRHGRIEEIRAFRANVAKTVTNSGQAKQAWKDDPTLDAWLIWTIWQVANPDISDQVAIEPDYAIYRDTGIAITKRGAARPEAGQFAAFLSSPEGAAIFAKWGWLTPAR